MKKKKICVECSKEKLIRKQGSCDSCYWKAHPDEAKAKYKRNYTLHKDKFLERAKRHARQRRELVDEIKASTPCADCGNYYSSECMDFDHIAANKIGNVATMVKNCSWTRILEEIDKCEIVCANCHRTRTKQRRERQG